MINGPESHPEPASFTPLAFLLAVTDVLDGFKIVLGKLSVVENNQRAVRLERSCLAEL